MVVINPGEPGELTLRVVIESAEYGREYKDEYDTLERIFLGVGKLVAKVQQQAAKDGIERIVGIAVIPKECYGDEAGYGFDLGEDDNEERDEL